MGNAALEVKKAIAVQKIAVRHELQDVYGISDTEEMKAKVEDAVRSTYGEGAGPDDVKRVIASSF